MAYSITFASGKSFNSTTADIELAISQAFDHLEAAYLGDEKNAPWIDGPSDHIVEVKAVAA